MLDPEYTYAPIAMPPEELECAVTVYDPEFWLHSATYPVSYESLPCEYTHCVQPAGKLTLEQLYHPQPTISTTAEGEVDTVYERLRLPESAPVAAL